MNSKLIVDILISDPAHPVNKSMASWKSKMSDKCDTRIIHKKSECRPGDILFLISCNELIGKDIRELYKKALVIHASNLPNGRGWSPVIWQVLENQSEIVCTLFEAVDKVDDGDIWHKESFILDGYELADEINEKLFNVECNLMTWAVENFLTVKPERQVGESTYYRKRNPKDSEIDPEKSLVSQFNMLRVADWERYPAFFEINGRKYKIKIERMD